MAFRQHWLISAGVVGTVASCHHQHSTRIFVEVPSPAPVLSDPAARGEWDAPLRLPPGLPPSTGGDEHEFAAFTIRQTVRFELAPSQAKDVPVDIKERSFVITQAIAFGKAGPLRLTIQDGASMAALAEVVRLPPDRAEAGTGAVLGGDHPTTIHIENLDADPVVVHLSIDVAPQRGNH